MPRKIAQSEVDEAVEELDRVRKSWMKRPDVNAVDVGLKIGPEGPTDQVAIRVHVSPGASPDPKTPESEGFPPRLGKFDVVLIEADYAPQDGPESV